MATNRFQFSDDFVLKNGKVGINTAEPQEKLEVVGDIKSDNLRVTGDSSLTTFEGFLNSNQNVDETLNVSTSTSASLSGEIIVGDDATVTIGSEATSSQGNIDSLKVFNTFTIPTGGTEDRPRKVKPGQLYYNVDFKTIEFWDGNVWRQVDNTTRSGRGVFGGGWDSSNVAMTEISYINISTLGNAINFGDFDINNNSRSGAAGASSSTRGLFMGGGSPTRRTDIDYITIASEGNGIDFGDLTETVGFCAGASSSTRGLRMGGATPANSSVIDYVEIATLGNAINFGNITEASQSNGGLSSPTRAFAFGGGSPAKTSKIDVVSIASGGTATRFGDMTFRNDNCRGNIQSSTRGVMGGGRDQNNNGVVDINYITTSSEGNAVEFGELTLARSASAGTSTQLRGIFYASGTSTPYTNIIDYVTIATTGNAIDFGDAIQSLSNSAGISDSHGGLGGF